MKNNWSIVSNVSLNDLYRVRAIIPHWLRVFGGCGMQELVLVFDGKPTSGRISKLHQGSFTAEQITQALDEVRKMDPRIRVIDLDRNEIDSVGLKWFGAPGVDRCQGGTPVFPFFYGIEAASTHLIIKLDSDMIFYNENIVEAVISSFNKNENLCLVSLPRFRNSPKVFSTRAFALNYRRISEKLPIPGIKVSTFRKLGAIARGRSPFRAPELAIDDAINCGYLQHVSLGQEYGFSLHVALSWWPGLSNFADWLAHVETGVVPDEQDSWDFKVSAWESYGLSIKNKKT